MISFVARTIAAATGREASGVEAALRGRLPRQMQVGKDFRLGPNVSFIAPRAIRLGNHVTLYGNTLLNAYGSKGSISIGDETHLDHFCVLYGQGGLRIGNRCAIASGATIYSQSNRYDADPEADIIDQPVRYARVSIGSDVWIGARAVILPGTSVGDHAVIAAGAVVRSDVAPWQVVGGVPAVVIGDRRERRRRAPYRRPRRRAG
jgi:acetyltransferase-like isoleucine patch superfamily enzyme